MNYTNNIGKVIDSAACTGCGICSIACPRGCIKTVLDNENGYFKTYLDNDICIHCGLCQRVCPVYTWDNHEKRNPYVGNYIALYSGHCTNEQLRKDCASGGVTTSILCYLLEQNMVDAVVVAVRNETKPLEGEFRIVSRKADIINAKGSVYSPISYADIIRKIKQSVFARLAVMGLPCHIEGLARLCETDKKLKEKIIFKIALVCGHTPSICAYHYSLKHLGIEPENVKGLSNRGEGWPGKMSINDGKTIVKIGYGSRYSWGQTLGSPRFTPPGCKHCSDATGYSADISICDAWLPQYASDKKGRNLFLIRTEQMQSVVTSMRNDGVIEMREESIDDYIKANKAVFKEKLYINSLRNAALQKDAGLYPRLQYMKIPNVVAVCMTRLLLMSEKIFIYIPTNDLTLFLLKAIKFLSQKWIQLKKY